MPLSRTTLEHMSKQAKDALGKWVAELTKRGVDRTAFRKDPKWRKLNADCNQIKRRIAKVAEVEAVNAEVAKRKAEKLAGSESAA